MLSVARRQNIKEIILEKKSATVTELADLFSVTHETIRRDLKQLEKEGVLLRSYGGAFIQSGVENLVDANLRTGIYIENKMAIARKCQEFIQNGEAIFLDNSTTAYYIAEAIQNKRVTLVTNSLLIINLLAENKNVNLIAVGGNFSVTEQAFYGMSTVEALAGYYMDKVFISSRSVSIENGVTEANDRWAQIRKTMLNRSKENYLVADFSKFGHTSFLRISGFDAINAIVTDKPLDAEWHEAMRQYNCVIYDQITRD